MNKQTNTGGYAKKTTLLFIGLCWGPLQPGLFFLIWIYYLFTYGLDRWVIAKLYGR